MVKAGDGYMIDAPPDEIDLHRSVLLIGQARDVVAPADRMAVLDEALELWRGPVLADVASDRLRQRIGTRYQDVYYGALERWSTTALEAGEHSQVIARLPGVVEAAPTKEALVACLALALYRSGDQPGALGLIDLTRDRLAEELGLDPGAGLQTLRLRMLRQDPVLNNDPELPSKRGTARNFVPRQLPLAVTNFVGRQDSVDRLDSLLDDGPEARTIIISAIAGMAGVGKTALAVHWGRTRSRHFPDGQLYVDLRGHDSREPLTSFDAVAHFLQALGVEPSDVPSTVEAASALLRTVLSGRRTLLLLDNAASAEQVRPLLVAEAGCVVLITSRHRLVGLVAREGASRVSLSTLRPAEAVDLLARILGTGGVAAEQEATAMLAKACGYLPLALRIAAANLAEQPVPTISSYVRELTDHSILERLQSEGDEQYAVRAAFTHSYDRLEPAAQRTFRLLGLHFRSRFSVAESASLTADSPTATMKSLDELERAHLISMEAPGQYVIHDLLWTFAHERSENEADVLPGTVRLLDHFLHTAYQATTSIDQHWRYTELSPAADGTHIVAFGDRQEAMAWLMAQHDGVLQAAHHASRSGLFQQANLFALGLQTYLRRRGYLQDMIAMHDVALTAATHLHDRAGEAEACRGLGNGYTLLGRFREALAFSERALELNRQLGHATNEGHTYLDLAVIHGGLGDQRAALASAQAALERFESCQHEAGIANSMNNIAWFHAELGELDDALMVCERSWQLQQESDDAVAQAYTLDTLGYIYALRSNAHSSAECYERAIELFQSLGDRLNEAGTLRGFGDALERLGRHDDSRVAWTKALTIFEELQHPQAEVLLANLRNSPVG